MIAVGLPGIVLAIVLKLTVKEPVRQQTEQERQRPLLDSLVELLKTPSWWGMVLGITLSSFANYAVIG